MMKYSANWIAAIGVAAILISSTAGCSHKADSGLSPAQATAANQMDEIAQRTGGDWNKTTPADKAFLLKQSFGDEGTAKMVLYSRINHSNSSPFGAGGKPAVGGQRSAPNGGPSGVPGSHP